jgi:hypothetical protein
VVSVHREVVALEDVAVVTSVDREVSFGLLRRVAKRNDLLVVRGMLCIEHFSLHGITDLIFSNVWCMVVAVGWHPAME